MDSEKKFNCRDSKEFQEYLNALGIVAEYLRENIFLIDTVVETLINIKNERLTDTC